MSNLAGDLGQVKNAETRDTVLAFFYKADADYGRAIAQALSVDPASIQRRAARLSE